MITPNKQGIIYKEIVYKNIIIFINKANNINWSFVKKQLSKIDYLLGNIDAIYYGHHQYLKDKNNLSVYNEGSILISDEVSDEETFLKCIVHEVIHSHSKEFEKNVFFQKASREYLEKKKYVTNVTGDGEKYNNLLYYNNSFDKYLLNFGYDKLKKIIKDKFPSAYSVTSFIEYIAICAEELFFGDEIVIIKMCPFAVKFIKSIGGNLEED
jgi:hypothetical protein